MPKALSPAPSAIARRPWAAAVLVGALVAGGRVEAEETLVPAELQTKILLRALAYDRQLAEGTAPLTIAIVFVAGDRASETERDEIAGTLRAQASSRTVKGRSVKVVDVAWPPAGARAALQAAGAEVAYVCVGAGGGWKGFRPVARELHLRSMASSALGIEEVAIAVARESGFPKLLVNLPVSREEGMDLDSELLKVARVVHE